LLDYCFILRSQSFEQHTKELQVCIVNLNNVMCIIYDFLFHYLIIYFQYSSQDDNYYNT
jgi:hypothetical protein